MNVSRSNRSPSRSLLSPTILRYRQKSSHQRRSSSSSAGRLWEIHRSSKEEIYYYNTVTGQSQWEKPSNEQLMMISKRVRIFPFRKRSKSTSISANHRSLNKSKKRRTNSHFFNRRKSFNDSPLSPPANERIPLNLVDPLPTPTDSITNTQEEQSKKKQINVDLSSIATQSCLHPSESTINAILQLEHSPSSTRIERPTIRLSNEQPSNPTYQFLSLRTDLISLRLRFESNRFHLLKCHYFFINQEDLLNKLR